MLARRCRLSNSASHKGSKDRWGGTSEVTGPCRRSEAAHIVATRDIKDKSDLLESISRVTHPKEVEAIKPLTRDDCDEFHFANECDLRRSKPWRIIERHCIRDGMNGVLVF